MNEVIFARSLISVYSNKSHIINFPPLTQPTNQTTTNEQTFELLREIEIIIGFPKHNLHNTTLIKKFSFYSYDQDEYAIDHADSHKNKTKTKTAKIKKMKKIAPT